MKMYMKSWWKSSFIIGSENYAEIIEVKPYNGKYSDYYSNSVMLYSEKCTRNKISMSACSNYTVYNENGEIVGKLGDIFSRDEILITV